MTKVFGFMSMILLIVSSCRKDNSEINKETLYYEDFENANTLDNWVIYTNILGHQTAFLEIDTMSDEIGHCLNVKSYTMRDMGHTAYDIGSAAKYLSSINGDGIYELNLMMIDNDDGFVTIKLHQIRDGEIIQSKELAYCCLSEWIKCTLIDTLDISLSDSLVIVLEKGPGFTVGENPAKFDAIELLKY